MYNKIIKYIVYFLSFLIFIAFIAVIYGLYIKISSKRSKNYNLVTSLSLTIDQEITNMQVIDKNRILITISNDDEIQGIIFDIDKQEIIQTIKK